MKYIEKYRGFIVGLLLVILFILQCTTALQETQTVDEGIYIGSGYLHLVTNDFRINIEHPPLIKEIIATPLLFVKAINEAFRQYSFHGYFHFTTDFLYENAVSADMLLLLARLPLMILSGLLGFFIYRWSRELFGTAAGLISLILYVFSPDIIAHGHYANLDLGVTVFFYLTIYYFYKFLKHRKKYQLLLTGILLGCALASKFSAVALLLILPILMILYYWQSAQKSLKQFCKKFLKFSAIAILLSILVIWVTYRFEIKKPIESGEFQKVYALQQEYNNGTLPENISPVMRTVLRITDVRTTRGKIIKSIVNHVPIPAYSYISGFLWQFRHNDTGQDSYLLGQHSSNGWWYYFPVAFFVKEPISVLILILILFLIPIYRFINKKCWSPWVALKHAPFYFYCLVIPIICFASIAFSSKLNLGIRYILPIFPFIFVGLGYVATVRFKKYHSLYIALLSALLIFNAYSTARAYPNYLSYFNKIIGGAKNGPKYLLDSNIDWGQDLKKLKQYLDEKNIDRVCLYYFGVAKPAYYGINKIPWPLTYTPNDFKAQNCVAAISVQYLYSSNQQLNWLQHYTPAARIGYSIYVYDFRQNNSTSP